MFYNEKRHGKFERKIPFYFYIILAFVLLVIFQSILQFAPSFTGKKEFVRGAKVERLESKVEFYEDHSETIYYVVTDKGIFVIEDNLFSIGQKERLYFSLNEGEIYDFEVSYSVSTFGQFKRIKKIL